MGKVGEGNSTRAAAKEKVEREAETVAGRFVDLNGPQVTCGKRDWWHECTLAGTAAFVLST